MVCGGGKSGNLTCTVMLHHYTFDSRPVHTTSITKMSATNNAWGTDFSDEELYAIAEASENTAINDDYESSSLQHSMSQQSTSQHQQSSQPPRSYAIILEEYQEHFRMIEECFSSQPTCDVVWKMYNDAWSKLNDLEIELQQAKEATSQ